jgi:hypothetical protein
MNNRARFGISGLASVILAAIAYLLPFTFMLYFFAPGFWIGDALPDRAVNVMGGYLFPVIVSALVWALVIYGVWRLTARGRTRS